MTSLFDRDSVSKVLDATERFIRLCQQNPDADKFEKAILSSYNNLLTKSQQLIEADKECTAAYDRVRLCDLILDDVLRKVHTSAKEYDREHPGSNTLPLLFAQGNLTPVITMPMEDEPDEASRISQKLNSFGSQHLLFVLAGEIDTAVKASRNALNAQDEATKAYYLMRTTVEITKSAVIRQYNGLYHRAASEVDSNFAERLFPQLSSMAKNGEHDNEPTSEN